MGTSDLQLVGQKHSVRHLDLQLTSKVGTKKKIKWGQSGTELLTWGV